MNEDKKIHNIEEFAHAWGIEVKDLKRSLYKYTSCGAFIEWNEKSVEIGSIAEGSDAEFTATYDFPFRMKDIEAWIEELEVLCEKAWIEANGEDYEVEDDEKWNHLPIEQKRQRNNCKYHQGRQKNTGSQLQKGNQ